MNKSRKWRILVILTACFMLLSLITGCAPPTEPPTTVTEPVAVEQEPPEEPEATEEHVATEEPMETEEAVETEEPEPEEP